MDHDDVVIVSTVRTPVGKFRGRWLQFFGYATGGNHGQEVVRRARVKPKSVDKDASTERRLLSLDWAKPRRGKLRFSVDFRMKWRRSPLIKCAGRD